MPHVKCAACRTRLYSAKGRDELVGDLCLGCGGLLEPVGELSEIVGFRSIASPDGFPTDDLPETPAALPGRPDDFIGRRKAILARAQLDAERWADDGGRLLAEAVALQLPDPNA